MRIVEYINKSGRITVGDVATLLKISRQAGTFGQSQLLVMRWLVVYWVVDCRVGLRYFKRDNGYSKCRQKIAPSKHPPHRQRLTKNSAVPSWCCCACRALKDTGISASGSFSASFTHHAAGLSKPAHFCSIRFICCFGHLLSESNLAFSVCA